MKNKQLNIGIAILVGVITLSAYGNEKNLSQQNTQISQTNSQTTNKDLEVDSTENMINIFTQQPLDLENYSLDYELETDDQPFFFWSQVTKSEYGYYFSIDNNTMVFFDSKSQNIIPLCNKPECMHNNSKCNAYFGQDTLEETDFWLQQLQYYKGNIYLIGFDSEGYANLYKVSQDGSSCEKYMQLYKTDISSTALPHFCIHRGYVYYIKEDEAIPKIRRIKLGDTETEIVFETSGIRPNLYRMLGYGDYIFFQSGNYIDETCVETQGGIYAYNIKTREVQLVKKDAIATYIIVNHTCFYKLGEDVRKFDLVTQKDEKIIDGASFDISADEMYVYIFDESDLKVYNHQGELICNIEDSNVYNKI